MGEDSSSTTSADSMDVVYDGQPESTEWDATIRPLTGHITEMEGKKFRLLLSSS
jgi:hypothetical protein